MIKNIVTLAVITFSLSISSCKSTSDRGNDRPSNTTEKKEHSKRGQHGERPSATEIFSMMDTNKDGKLAESEIKGPLKKDFSTVDTNKDGFITIEELENAPKPERKKR